MADPRTALKKDLQVLCTSKDQFDKIWEKVEEYLEELDEQIERLEEDVYDLEKEIEEAEAAKWSEDEDD